MLDDIADIPGMVDMTIIHASSVPEPEAGCNPGVEQALAAAYAAQQADQPDQARTLLERALQNAPDDAALNAAYGLLLYDMGALAAALPALSRALMHMADRSDILLAYAAVCLDQRQPEQAEAPLRAYLEQRPGHMAVMIALAENCAARSMMAEALALGHEVMQLGQPPAAFARRYADWLADSGDYRAAIETLNRALQRDGHDVAGWAQLGSYWLAMQEPHKAEQALSRARILQPDFALPTMMQPETDLSQAYVRALFDGYADRFDHDLQDKLRYRAPALLHDAVRSLWPQPPRPCAMLDLGCGTGLAGKAFADMATTCTGIDLAPRMLAQAEKTGCYQQLIAGDVVAECAQLHEYFDLIVAADVLVYLGALEPLFAQIRTHLAPQGLFALTIERHDGPEDWVLQPQRRTAHRPDYLTGLAAAHGLTLRLQQACTPRLEKGQPVDGVLLIFSER